MSGTSLPDGRRIQYSREARQVMLSHRKLVLSFTFAVGVVLPIAGTLWAQPPAAPPTVRPPAASGITPASAAGSPTVVVARVNGETISQVALDRALERFAPDKREDVREEILTHLIDTTLVDQFLVQGKLEASQVEIGARIQEMKKEAKEQNKNFDDILAEMKLALGELDQHVAADIRWDKYLDSQATEPALRKLFQTDPALFDGSTVRARHILMPTATTPTEIQSSRQKLLQIKAQVEQAGQKAGQTTSNDKLEAERKRADAVDESFTAFAKQYSTCPSKAQGGDVGWFARDGSMVEQFSRVAFSQKNGTVSDVVETSFGYHLILTVDRKAGRDVKFEDVKDDVKETFGERLREQVAQHMRRTAKIEAATKTPK